jgi:hypothetical protein
MIIERLKGFWCDDLELEHRQVIVRNAIEQIERLRAENEKLHREAAIRIDQIEREQEAHLRTIADYNRAAVKIEKLREALKPFAEKYTVKDDNLPNEHNALTLINVGDLRAARKALGETDD